MLCEKCGKNQANTHLKQVINGKASELNLCEQCAQELGLSEFNPFESIQFNGMGINIGNLLGSMFSQSVPKQNMISPGVCNFCGRSFEEFAQNAQAGCSNCYHEFYNQLLPSIQRIHGKTRHVGKIPASASNELKLKRELENLKNQLNAAVDAQEYEKAATLRDKIKEIEGQV